MENFELVVCGNLRQVLRGNEDELSMLHIFGYFDQSLEGTLSRHRVEKHIELVHHTERSFEALSNGEEEGKSGEAPFTTTQCLDIVGLSTFISVVLLKNDVQLLIVMIKLNTSCTVFLLQKFIKRKIRHLSNVRSKVNPSPFTFLNISYKHLHVLFDSFDLFHFGIQIFLCSKVLIPRHNRISFGQVPALLLIFDFLLSVGNPRLAFL
mmetsp:Transcript_2655/g.4841  ORF Transcript_2655/g.4841 Transcript_2655/m.4841 type:complete len:208 (-) Transcript_2655:488-1111(-)